MSRARCSSLFQLAGTPAAWVAQRLQAEPLLRTVLSSASTLLQVVEYVNDLQHRVNDALQLVRSMPIAVHHMFAAVPFTAGQVQNFPHKLGRTWVGVLVLSDQGVAWNGFATHVAPAGSSLGDSAFVQLTAGTNAGKFSVLVW